MKKSSREHQWNAYCIISSFLHTFNLFFSLNYQHLPDMWLFSYRDLDIIDVTADAILWVYGWWLLFGLCKFWYDMMHAFNICSMQTWAWWVKFSEICMKIIYSKLKTTRSEESKEKLSPLVSVINSKQSRHTFWIERSAALWIGLRLEI